MVSRYSEDESDQSDIRDIDSTYKRTTYKYIWIRKNKTKAFILIWNCITYDLSVIIEWRTARCGIHVRNTLM